MNSPILPVDLAEDPGPDDRQLDSRDLSAELAPPATDYLTQIDVNHILGNLFTLLAANRISAKRAGTLAYICSAILKSQEGMRTQVRFMEWTSFQWLTKALQERYGPKRKTKQPSGNSAEPSSANEPPANPPQQPATKEHSVSPSQKPSPSPRKPAPKPAASASRSKSTAA